MIPSVFIKKRLECMSRSDRDSFARALASKTLVRPGGIE